MSKLKLLQETTVWPDKTQNHIYIFDGSDTKIAGYIKMGTEKAIKFSNPMVFSKRGRTFKAANKKNFDLTVFGE